MTYLPPISVLLPYRDCEATVAEALASVLAQQASGALEVLAIDDGSQDQGPAIVTSMARRDARVVPLASGGAGIVGALRAGLAVARHGLIARMDADDIARPERFSRQLALLASDPALGAVGTQVRAFPDAAVGEGLRRYVAWQNALVTPADHAREIFVESPLCHPSIVLRRDALEAVGGFRDTPWAEDYDLFLRLDAAGYGLAKVPAELLDWRHRPSRATFSDARYTLERFREARARYLAPRLIARGRPVVVWGAGPTGKRLARALEQHAVRAERFVDIDPKKIGRPARGTPIVSPAHLAPGRQSVVVAVGARGARDLIRAELTARGFVEGDDFVCAS